jgi:hypothetical protein
VSYGYAGDYRIKVRNVCSHEDASSVKDNDGSKSDLLSFVWWIHGGSTYMEEGGIYIQCIYKGLC